MIGGFLSFLSILRNGNVALLNLRKVRVALSIVRKGCIACPFVDFKGPHPHSDQESLDSWKILDLFSGCPCRSYKVLYLFVFFTCKALHILILFCVLDQTCLITGLPHVREKSGKSVFFQGQGNVREF